MAYLKNSNNKKYSVNNKTGQIFVQALKTVKFVVESTNFLIFQVLPLHFKIFKISY